MERKPRHDPPEALEKTAKYMCLNFPGIVKVELMPSLLRRLRRSFPTMTRQILAAVLILLATPVIAAPVSVGGSFYIEPCSPHSLPEH